jgi:hypothetical protein
MKHILVLILTLAFALAPARADELLPLFDLQSQSGQLWTAIKAHLDAKDAKIAALTAERDAHAQTIADFLAADDAGALLSLTKLRGDARKSEKQKRRDAAQAEFDAAKAKLDAAKAALNTAGN